MRDDDHRHVRARFKWAKTKTKMYAIGMERLAYVLGAEELGLPVPQTYIDDCGKQTGSAQLRVQGIPWKHAAVGVSWIFNNVLNRDLWPLAIVFDVWLGNPDRHDQNLIVQPEPVGTRPAVAQACTVWLVDSERAGLWTPGKFGESQVEKVVIPPTGQMRDDVELMIGKAMPADYAAAFQSLDDEARQAHLDRVRAIPDNLIEAAVNEVCPVCVSSTARDLTMQFLATRRDNIDNLANTVFPTQVG